MYELEPEGFDGRLGKMEKMKSGKFVSKGLDMVHPFTDMMSLWTTRIP